MEIRLLGRLEAEHETRVLTPGRRQERCLLGILALEPDMPVPVDRLADLLWDDHPPATARATLQTYISRLRSALDPDGDGRGGLRLVHSSDGYAVRIAPHTVDALRFRSLAKQARDLEHPPARAQLLRQALGLWRGPLLAGDASARLTDRIAAPWHEARLEATEAAIEAELAGGRHAELIAELSALMAEHPYRERFTALYMRACYLAGRQAEALVAYQDTRKILVGELGLDPGPELQDLHSRILAGEATLASPVAAEPVSLRLPPPGPTPRQLPTAPGHFIGRNAELDQLAAFARCRGAHTGAAAICIVDGMAGVGKTAFAVHAAHLLAPAYPDGQLFLDLHGYTERHPPRPTIESLNWLLQSLGVPAERIPADCDQAAALYWQRLANSKTLIVLDNASTEAQVRPLLPGTSSCMVLVTSRKRLKGLDDAHIVSLDLLEPERAIALLAAVAGPGRIAPEERSAREVAELCGYLPLALRIAGALLRHRPNWPIEHLATQLRDQRHRLAALADGERELTAVFDLSCASLDAPHLRLWRRLGQTPCPELDAYAGTALADLDPTTCTGLLEDLVDHNLLTAYEPGRYRLHDLLRAHARNKAADDPAAERAAALERLMRYYAYTAHMASASIARYPVPVPNGEAPAYTPDLSDPDSARRWLGTERRNLEAAFNYACAQGLNDHAIGLATGLAEIL
jgi:DNA-binding SARP family transcriptional activator